jgi:hypothetical protein
MMSHRLSDRLTHRVEPPNPAKPYVLPTGQLYHLFKGHDFCCIPRWLQQRTTPLERRNV